MLRLKAILSANKSLANAPKRVWWHQPQSFQMSAHCGWRTFSILSQKDSLVGFPAKSEPKFLLFSYVHMFLLSSVDIMQPTAGPQQGWWPRRAGG